MATFIKTQASHKAQNLTQIITNHPSYTIDRKYNIVIMAKIATTRHKHYSVRPNIPKKGIITNHSTNQPRNQATFPYYEADSTRISVNCSLITYCSLDAK
jgi:hypothetical protein